jgi:predicted transcriptional regulator
MDKILSARVDEAIIRQIGRMAQKLHTTKKAVIEAAILYYAEKDKMIQDHDVFEETLGAWKRPETPGETVKQVRRSFQESMKRHRK